MNIRNQFVTLALSLLLAACTAEEATVPQEQETSFSATLSVTVSADGFSPTGNTTRAVNKLFTTHFANGDRIGIFAISEGGVVLDANVPYQYNGTAWTPVNANNTIHHYHYAGVTYFAYYPYSAEMDAATNEADIISKFTPKTNQSVLTDYSASDLMTGTGTVTNETLSFSLSHKMSLIILRPEGDRYLAGDYEYRSLYTAINTQSAGSVTAGYEAGDGMIRFLVTPATSTAVAISYTTAENATPSYSTTLTPSAGRYYRYNISTGGIGDYTTAIGDFYMANGSIVSQSKSLTESQKKNCMGVIFSLSTSDTDKANGWTNGYVMAKEHISNTGNFGQHWSLVSMDEPGLDYKATRDAARSDKDGYTETEAMLTAHGADTQYGVWMQLQKYRKENPVPADVNRSPWYIPSCGQWYDILVNLGKENNLEGYYNGRVSWTTNSAGGKIYVYNNISAALKNAGGNFNWAVITSSSWLYIWCSSEHDVATAWDIRFDNHGNVYLDYASKNDNGRRLAHTVLAF